MGLRFPLEPSRGLRENILYPYPLDSRDLKEKPKWRSLDLRTNLDDRKVREDAVLRKQSIVLVL